MNVEKVYLLTGGIPVTTIAASASQTGDVVTFAASAVGQQIVNGGNIVMNGGNSWVSQASGDCIRFTCVDGVNWIETTRQLPVSATSQMDVSLRPSNVIWENMSRRITSSTTITAPASGTLNLFLMWLPAGLVITKIGFVSGTASASVPTHQWFALFNSSRQKLAVTADDTNSTWASQTSKALTVSGGPFTTTYAGLHYVGIVVTASTVPTLTGSVSGVTGLTPFISGASNSSLTDPTTCPSTAAVPSERNGYAYVFFQ